jgi:hypothetical protein
MHLLWHAGRDKFTQMQVSYPLKGILDQKGISDDEESEEEVIEYKNQQGASSNRLAWNHHEERAQTKVNTAADTAALKAIRGATKNTEEIEEGETVEDTNGEGTDPAGSAEKGRTRKRSAPKTKEPNKAPKKRKDEDKDNVCESPPQPKEKVRGVDAATVGGFGLP